MNELQSLQNAANIIGLTIHEKYMEDKRMKIKKYFANIGNKTVSPVLNYNDLNHFIFGWIASKKN